MTIPDFQTLMLPLLGILEDGQEHVLNDCVEPLAAQFRLTDTERKELLPSGSALVFNSRIGWARTYFGKAGLLEATGRARFRITQRGLDVLKSSPPRIDTKFLRQFPEFAEFLSGTAGKGGAEQSNGAARVTQEEKVQTPEELLESSYLSLRQALAGELLERIRKCSPAFFEQLVVDLLVAMGYGGSRKDAGQAIGQSGDDGVDGIIKEDKLGLDVVYIQAKRWESVVGRPIVQAFAGSLEGQRARKGVLITTSHFSPDARDYVGRIEKRIVLIDGKQLAQFMIDHGIGVTEVVTYCVKKADSDYFGGD